MTLTPLARWWFGTTALVVAIGMIVQLSVTASSDVGHFTDTLDRVLNVFTFFTVLSNLIVGGTSLMLAAGWANQSTVFRTFRLIGVVAITLTFIVFHAVLRDLQDLTGQAAFADLMLHTLSPLLCTTGWVVFGPRGQTNRRIVAYTLIYLLGWGVFTLIRGEIIDWYPYPFMNPIEQGYARVTVNLVVIGAVFVGLGAGADALDGWLSRRGSDSAEAATVRS